MKTKTVHPNERAHLFALRGAVLIETADSRFIVLKPSLARQVAQNLAKLADLAEAAEKDPSLGKPANEYFKTLLFKKGK
jgi:hypothetical protein